MRKGFLLTSMVLLLCCIPLTSVKGTSTTFYFSQNFTTDEFGEGAFNFTVLGEPYQEITIVLNCSDLVDFAHLELSFFNSSAYNKALIATFDEADSELDIEYTDAVNSSLCETLYEGYTYNSTMTWELTNQTNVYRYKVNGFPGAGQPSVDWRVGSAAEGQEELYKVQLDCTSLVPETEYTVWWSVTYTDATVGQQTNYVLYVIMGLIPLLILLKVLDKLMKR